MREISTNIKKPELVAKRRQKITEAAMDLFLKNGYHGTTIRQICEASGVNRASIYDYFASKEDILVYIYKKVVDYSEGNTERKFPATNIAGWKDVEPFIRSTIDNAWVKKEKTIQLLYKETMSLDQDSLMTVAKIESDYVRWIAENLRNGLGLAAITEDLKIIANLIVFINAFRPLRGWNMPNFDKNKILDIIIEMIMTKLKTLKNTGMKKK